MEIPSRRTRKQARRSIIKLLGVLVFIVLAGLFTFVAIHTGNYMGLAVVYLVLFFLGIGFNIGNLRNLLPGLSSIKQIVRYIAVVSYAGIGLAILSLTSQLPQNDLLPPVRQYAENFIKRQQILSSGGAENTASDIHTQVNSKPVVSREQLELKEPVLVPNNPAIVTKLDILKSTPATVTKVLNANTLQINNQQIVRLIGIEVPERLQLAATRYIHSLVLNQEVSLEICTDSPIDEEGRIRAMVMVRNDSINSKLLELGYSSLIITAPCSLDLSKLRKAEEQAKQKKIGIWEKHP